MALHKNSFNLGGGFNIGAAAPIDSRMLVDFISDLTNAFTWDPSSTPIYTGLIVGVLETNEVYMCINDEQFTSLEDGWKKINGHSIGVEDDVLIIKD